MKQQGILVRLHAHFADVVHDQCRRFKLLCHDSGRIVKGHQVFMSDIILSANLVDDEF